MATSIDRLRAALSDRYELDRELGAGGMATVYLATDRKHRRRVALKVMRPDAVASVGPARFLREIEIAASLVHPNILGLHDSGEADGLLFYVMPYVEGDSLRDRLRRDGRLPLDEAVRIVHEIADALHHAHAHGVVHRDIKPENILFESGHAIVTDFGVARAVTAGQNGNESVTTTGVVVGTPAYMSPEQAIGDRDLDARCDVYSLGCVAFEMLTGERPFAAPTAQAVLARKLGGERLSLRSVVREIPADVERVVLKAMARATQDRYASVKEFSADLQRAASGRLTTGRWRWPVPIVSVMAMALLVAMIAVAIAVWRGRRATPSMAAVTSLAVLPFTSAAGSPPPHVIEGMHDEIIGELGRLPLRVISRTSVMRFRGSSKTIPEIARELHVDAVIEGTFYWTTDSVRIQVRLVRAVPEERQLWSRPYDTDARHLMTLHSSVARGIVEQLRLALTSGDSADVAAGESATAVATTSNPEAYDLYLQGRYWLNRRTAEGLAKSQSALRQSIALDDSFAPAHALLAQALAMAVDWHYEQVDPIAMSRLAIDEANRALALDSTNADALAARGRVLSAVHAPAEVTRADFERALRLAPQHANARGWFALELAWRGRGNESRTQHMRSVELDPVAPGRRMGFAISALNFGDPAVALREARRAIQMEPTLLPPRAAEALALLLLDRPAECAELNLDPYVAIRALCFHTLGRRDDAKRLIDSLTARVNAATRRGGPFSDVVLGANLALYFAWTGDVDATLTWLRRAATITTAAAPFLYINSKVFDPVRTDPKFQAGLEQLKKETWQKVNTPPVLPSTR
jgi:eukaryotic-like serine/threonine-protein kinase